MQEQQQISLAQRTNIEKFLFSFCPSHGVIPEVKAVSLKNRLKFYFKITTERMTIEYNNTFDLYEHALIECSKYCKIVIDNLKLMGVNNG